MKYNKSLLNEAFDALTSNYELKESVDPFDLEFNDYEMVEDMEEDAEEINAQELVTEDLDQDLDKKLDAHNVYIDYLRKEIEALENSIKNEKNDEIKAAKEAHLAELNQALETALPDAVKTGAVDDSVEVTPEADVEQEVVANEESDEDIDLDEFFNVK